MNPDAFFVWHTYDVRALLPDRWQEDLVEITRSIMLEPRPPTAAL